VRDSGRALAAAWGVAGRVVTCPGLWVLSESENWPAVGAFGELGASLFPPRHFSNQYSTSFNPLFVVAFSLPWLSLTYNVSALSRLNPRTPR
jgi:hypothetical protein